MLAAVCVNRKFLYSAFYGFTSQDTIDFFEQSGMHTKTERGNRVFPASDHASDVIAALSGRLKKSGVKVMLHAEVKELLTEALPGAQIACERGSQVKVRLVEKGTANRRKHRCGGLQA